jgi:pimeloyl-ACP methyl ester carboxylesterase
MTPIVYLHGFASSPASKKAQYFRRRFAEAGATVEIPDLAAGDFEGLTVSGQLQVIERAAAGRVVSLIGSSMGGYLAALYAARHPGVERVVLMAPAFRFVKRWPERLGAEDMERWRTTGYLPVFHYGDGREARVGYGLIEDAAQYEDFPDVRQPVLLYHGRGDDVVRVETSEEFALSRPNVVLRVVDSGHELIDVLAEMCEEAMAFLGVSALK